MTERLDGGPSPVRLNGWTTLYAPGFTGTATEHVGADPTTRSANPRLFPATLDEALGRSGLQELDTFELVLEPASPDRGTPNRGGPSGEGRIEMITDARTDRAAVVLIVDEHGVATWHFPEDADEDGRHRFFLRSPETVGRPADDDVHRGLVGIGARLVKTFVYDVTDPLVGGPVSTMAKLLESRTRPYRLRSFLPGTHDDPLPGHELGEAQIRELGAGRALLFVHGTFSSASTGFGEIPVPALEALHDDYDGRVFAFDHPTVSEDPLDNIEEFLRRIPDDVSLDLDVVSHSRGGLVTRTLAGEHRDLSIDPDRVRVRRAVFAGTPNQGSRLLSPDYLPDLIDRYTTALNVLWFGPVAEVFDAVLLAVKVLARGTVDGLEGVTAGDPDGPFMQGLRGRPGPGTTYHGIAADFEPPSDGLGSFLKARTVDGVFENADHDMVVTADSVRIDGMHNFHLYAPDTEVDHMSYFRSSTTGPLLRSWLTAGDG
ncbi:MAG: hypothetical protein AAF081_04395 [Actinomycetota bacterium]